MKAGVTWDVEMGHVPPDIAGIVVMDKGAKTLNFAREVLRRRLLFMIGSRAHSLQRDYLEVMSLTPGSMHLIPRDPGANISTFAF